MNVKWIKQEPYVDDSGIWVPINEYAHEGFESAYRCVITKEIFVEAYNKWIAHNALPHNDDDADCWCE